VDKHYTKTIFKEEKAMKKRILGLVVISTILLVISANAQIIFVDHSTTFPVFISNPYSRVQINSDIDVTTVAIVVNQSAEGTIITNPDSYTISGGGEKIGIDIRANGVTVVGLVLAGFYDGIYISGGGRATISSNTVSNCSRAGIYVGHSSGNNISNNKVYNNLYGGIGLVSGSNNNIISDNIVDNNGSGGTGGIYVWQSNEVEIYNNQGLRGNNPYGIYVAGSQYIYLDNNDVFGTKASCHVTTSIHVYYKQKTVVKDVSVVPLDYSLEQNFPNPFNPVTVINYSLQTSGHVQLAVYDIHGRQIAVLIDNQQNIGNHSAEFHANNLPSGIYFYHLKTKEFFKVKKMVLQK